MQTPDKTHVVSKLMSARDFNAYGMETLAYVKTVLVDGKPLQSVHAADGTPLTVLDGRELAFATVRQHDLEPASVH